MNTARRTLPAPRKDLSKVCKRPRTTTPPLISTPDTAIMEVEDLFTSMRDDDVQLEFPTPPRPSEQQQQQSSDTRVNHYYTEVQQQLPPLPQHSQAVERKNTAAWKPRLLIRQVYKLGTDASVVIGLESVRDYNASICVVNNYCSINIRMNDLISLRSMSIQATVDRYFNEATTFKPIFMKNCVIVPNVENTIMIYNHSVVSDKSCWWNKKSVRTSSESGGVPLGVCGWNSLKCHLDSIESYYNICVECSDTVQNLLLRYANFLTEHYRSDTFLSGNIVAGPVGKREVTLNQDYVQRITNDMPLFLQELNKERLPPERYQLEPLPALHPTLLTWLDSEIRHYCAPNLVQAVLDNLKFHYIW